MILVVLLIVGAFFLLRKKSAATDTVALPPAPPISYPTTATPPQMTPQLDPLIGQTGPVATGAILPSSQYGSMITSAYGSDKIAMPITSPSLYYSDPTRFTALAAGNCQCDTYQCCYWAPFQGMIGDYQTNYNITRKCVRINYGDTPAACQQAFALYQSGVAAFNSAKTARAFAAETAGYIRRRPRLWHGIRNAMLDRARRRNTYVT